MKKNLIITSVILATVLMACQSKYDVKKLYGEWNLSEWVIESTGKKVSNKMNMNFQKDGTYIIDYGSKKENGKFWIANEFLHTVETGKAEKKVKLLQLVQDSLMFQMNRAGQLEKVSLVKI